MHRVLKILPSAAVSESKYLPKRPIFALKKKKKNANLVKGNLRKYLEGIIISHFPTIIYLP